MATRTKKPSKPAFSWWDFTQAELITLLDVIGGDGHTIYSTDYLLERDVDSRIVNQFAFTHKSDGTLKGSIERNGVIVKSMEGVYGLTVLWSLGAHYGVESNKMGRGSQARELTEGIREHLA